MRNTLLETLPSCLKIIATYWIWGKFDVVWIYEAPNKKALWSLF